MEADTGGSSAVASDRDAVWISTKRFDILFDEFQRLLLVKQPPVAATLFILCAHKPWRTEQRLYSTGVLEYNLLGLKNEPN